MRCETTVKSSFLWFSAVCFLFCSLVLLRFLLRFESPDLLICAGRRAASWVGEDLRIKMIPPSASAVGKIIDEIWGFSSLGC